MALVQDMLRTKQKEIENCARYMSMQEDGLTCSETMLEEDTKQFLNFFNQIKTDTQKSSDALDVVKKEKQEKQQELKTIQDDIYIQSSQISKNIEALEIYNSYKIFFDQLSGKQLSLDYIILLTNLTFIKTKY